MKHQLEIERKYDIAPEDAEKLDPGELSGFGAGRPETLRMAAVYYDTADFALARAQVALRRRTGGGDDGWHVKYRAGKARGELHFEPLKSPGRIPAAVRKVLVGITLGEDIEPVATVDTRRVVYPVLTENGTQHAELCVDTVCARDERAGVDRKWSECEVELSRDDLSPQQSEAVFAALEAVLFAAGAAPSTSPAKIARALGQDDAGATPPATERPAGPPSSGADVLARICAELGSQVQQWDFAVRLDAEDAVHQLRVRCRSLRSVLHSARKFIPRDRRKQLDGRLKALGRALSNARDEEVVGERIAELLEAESTALISAPAREDLREAAASRAEDTARPVRRMLDAPEHLGLLRELRELPTDGSFTEQAGQLSAKKFAKAVLGTALRDVLAELAPSDAQRSGDAEPGVPARELGERVSTAEQDRHRTALDFERLHDTRKAVKTVRYVAAALQGAGADPGKKRSRAASHAEDYQDELGEITDGAVAERWLAHTARDFRRASTDRYALGVLHGMELARLRERLASAPEILEGLAKDLERELPDRH